MMFPIGLAILSEMVRRESERLGRAVRPSEIRFGTGLMLTPVRGRAGAWRSDV